MTGDYLRVRLEIMRDKTASAAPLTGGGYWVGDTAGERRVLDDLQGGRLYWLQARRMALEGIEALDAGDREAAEVCAWAATDYYVAALEGLVRPSDLAKLGRQSQRRGRPRKN